jgi:hypothetical protein
LDRKLQTSRAIPMDFRLKFFPGPGGPKEMIAESFRLPFNSDINIRAN